MITLAEARISRFLNGRLSYLDELSHQSHSTCWIRYKKHTKSITSKYNEMIINYHAKIEGKTEI